MILKNHSELPHSKGGVDRVPSGLDLEAVHNALCRHRLGVKWFETLRISSSQKTKSSVRPRSTLEVHTSTLFFYNSYSNKEFIQDSI